jgi:multidrug efflux pump subunit AcrA (membrane-fusion protein)
VLLSVVAFVVFYCVWVPVRAHVAAGTRGASVMLVASPLLEVRAPQVTGVFRATRPLAHGQRVRKGELLGRIDSPALEQEIERADVELRVLEARRLRLEQARTLSESSAPETIEARELAGRAEVISRSLQRLRATRSKLAVRAPADGLVQVGLPASVAVTPDQAIVSVYPDGGSLLVEVTGPLELVDRLNREGQLAASFPVAGGSAEVEARPLRNSVRCFRKTIEGRREETWATVQCVPFAVPPALHSPGLIGELRR